MASSDTGTPPNTSIGALYLGPCGALAIIGLCLCATRIYTRVRPTLRLGWDDYLILAAEIISLASYVVSIPSVTYGWGRPSIYVSPSDQIVVLKLRFMCQLSWILAVALVRISVACSLMRLSAAKVWRGVLSILVALQLGITIICLVMLFFSCTPLRASWEPVSDLRCWDRKYTIIVSWVGAGIYIVEDFALALMPIKLIWKLNRPLPEKILVGCLMAMGLLATAILLVKTTTFKNASLGDPLVAFVESSMWAKLEEQLGIICACLPCLKSSAEKLLNRIGFISKQQMTISISKTDSANSHQHEEYSNNPSMRQQPYDVEISAMYGYGPSRQISTDDARSHEIKTV